MSLLPSSAIAPIAIVGVGVAAYVALISYTGRWGTERARFDVISKVHGLEIRRYHPCIVASASIPEPDIRRAGNAGFRSVASYIFGGNVVRGGLTSSAGHVAQQPAAESMKIAMTTPVVFQPRDEPVSQKIAMTAPVIMTPSGQGSAEGTDGQVLARPAPAAHTISFVMPAKYTEKGAASMPLPTNRIVQLQDVPQRFEAVSTRRGRWPSQAEMEGWYQSTLDGAVKAGLQPVKAAPETGWNGVVVRHYAYDPPFVPDFLKVSEVSVEIEPPA